MSDPQYPYYPGQDPRSRDTQGYTGDSLQSWPGASGSAPAEQSTHHGQYYDQELCGEASSSNADELYYGTASSSHGGAPRYLTSEHSAARVPLSPDTYESAGRAAFQWQAGSGAYQLQAGRGAYQEQAGRGAYQEQAVENPSNYHPRAGSSRFRPNTGRRGSTRERRIRDPNGSTLDPNFQEEPHSYFQPGRIFMMVWTEALGSTATNDTSVSVVRFGEQVYTQIRRFVVVVAKRKHCLCVPVTTYGNQGATKRDIDLEDHAIIYTGSTEWPRLLGEEDMTRDSIQVDEYDPANPLTPYSRVNFGKVYTVEHNVKVKDYGKVSDRSLPKLKYYYSEVNELA